MYGLWLYKDFQENDSEDKVRLEIYSRDYCGESIEIYAIEKSSIVLTMQNEATSQIAKTDLTFAIKNTSQFNYTELFTPDATKYLVVLKSGEVNLEKRWSGYLTPDSYAEYLSYRDSITLTARDNFGMWNDLEYDYNTTPCTIKELLNVAFAKIGHGADAMSIVYYTNKSGKSSVSGKRTLAIDAVVDNFLLLGKSWWEVITNLLKSIGCQIRFSDNNIIGVYDITQLSDNSFVDKNIIFTNKSGFVEILPAWRKATFEQSYGIPDNAYSGYMNRDQYHAFSFIPYYKGTESWEDADKDCTLEFYRPVPGLKWNLVVDVNDYRQLWGLSKGQMYNWEDGQDNAIYLPFYRTSSAYKNHLDYSERVLPTSKSLSFKFKINNTPRWTSNNNILDTEGIFASLYITGQNYLNTIIPMNVVLEGSNGKNYIMAEKWQEINGDISTRLQFQVRLDLSSQLDGAQANTDREITINIQTIPVAGVLKFVFYAPMGGYTLANKPLEANRCVKLSGFNLSYSDEISTGTARNITINPAHNVTYSDVFDFGQIPEDDAGMFTDKGGLFSEQTDNPALIGFRRNDIELQEYHLLELVSREIIHFNLKNYKRLSGTIKPSRRAESLRFNNVFVYDGLRYLPTSYSLNILDNTMSITSMQEVDNYLVSELSIIYGKNSGGKISGGVASGYTDKGYVQYSHTHVKLDITDFSHGHTQSDVTGLVDALAGKAALVHDHSGQLIRPATFVIPASTPVGQSAGDMCLFVGTGSYAETPTGGGSSAWADITGKPTTIAGYGITDAYTKSEIGSFLNGKAALVHTHTISQITDFPTSLKNPYALTWSGYSSGSYDGSSAVNIAIPTTLPASDVYAWAKSSTKPSYSFSEIQNIVQSGNEFNFIPAGYNDVVWFNYRSIDMTSASISQYWFGNGSSNGGLADIKAANIYSSDNLVLHAGNYNSYITQSYINGLGISASYASSADNAGLLGGQLPSYYAAASSLGNYAPLNGVGASGTWGINISGNAATATNAAQLGGQLPSYYASANSLGNYLPLSGGRMTGGIKYSLEGDLNVTRDDGLKMFAYSMANSPSGSPYYSTLSAVSSYVGFQLSVFGGVGYDDLMYRKLDGNRSWSGWYNILHSGNCNNTSTDWSARNITAGNISCNGLEIPTSPPANPASGKWYLYLS